MAQDIRNTTTDMGDDVEKLLFLAEATMHGGDPTSAIERQERDGQAQLVNSDQLPTRVLHTEGGDAAFLALGFTFGPADAGDALFRPATLPAGWKRQGTEHAMWSKLVDQYGRERVPIFYKAAFYDRDAHMSLVSPYGYLRSVLYGDQRLVLDDDWLTVKVALRELAAIAESCDERAREADNFAESRPGDDYWPSRAVEHRADAQKARDLAAGIAS